MMTLSKTTVRLGDTAQIARLTDYVLEQVNAPSAYARGDYWVSPEVVGPGGGAPAAGRANTMWLGSELGLARYGVTRGEEVTREQLGSALQGQNWLTDEQVRTPGTVQVPRVVPPESASRVKVDVKPETVGVDAVSTIDLTYGAPPSTKPVYARASEEQRRGMEQAMLVAANAGLEYLVQTKPVVNWGKAGGREAAIGSVAAAALHVTARTAADDTVPMPHLHVHTVLVGVVRSDGKVVAADSSAFFRRGAALEGGAVFRLKLAEELAKLGYRIRPNTGKKGRYFEIEGVPQGLIDRMSSRAREVVKAARERELVTGEAPRGADLAALAKQTRAKKDKGLSAREVLDAWDAITSEFGFGAEEAQALLSHTLGYAETLEMREAAAREALERQMEQYGPAVTLGFTRAAVFEAATGRLTLDEAFAWFDKLELTRELVPLEEGWVTTPRIRARERAVMDVVVEAARRPGAALSRRAREAGIARADASLGEGKTLDREQLDAIEKLTGGAGWAVLSGLAGSGKGPTLEAIAEAYRTDGWQVIASALDGTTKQRLGAQIGAEAYTLARLKWHVEKGLVTLGERTVILIEEASKVGLEEWEYVVDWVAAGARVLPIGHDRQHGAIKLPGLFGEMVAAAGTIPVSELTMIRRARHLWIADIQRSLIEGDGRDVVALLRANDGLTFYDTSEQAMTGMLDRWDVTRRAYQPEESMILVSSSNQDVSLINMQAQWRRLDNGELGAESVPAVGLDYEFRRGDVVILRTAPYEFPRLGNRDAPRRVENGQVGVVDSVDERRQLVNVLIEEPGEEQRLVSFDLAELRRRHERGDENVPSLRLGYAGHSFPVQGATLENVLIFGAHGNEATLVAMTRPRDRLEVHVPADHLSEDKKTEEELEELYGTRISTREVPPSTLRLSVDPTLKIAPQRPVIEAAPEMATRSGVVEAAEAIARDAALRPDLEAREPRDLLVRYRDAIGERPMQRIETRATALREWLAPPTADQLAEGTPVRDVRWLRQQLQEIGEPLAELRSAVRHDRAAERTLKRCGRDVALASGRARTADAEADRREAAAEDLKGLRNRRTRQEQLDAAAVQRRAAEQARAEEAKARAELERLRAQEGHVDAWVAEHHDRLARWLALQQELVARHAKAVVKGVEHAYRYPPEPVRELIGSPPEADAPELGEWRALTAEYVAEHMWRDFARLDGFDRASLPARDTRERRELAERVDRLREQRGMEPLERSKRERGTDRESGVEPPPDAPDVGI